MFSKIDRNELKPSHMESLIKGNIYKIKDFKYFYYNLNYNYNK